MIEPKFFISYARKDSKFVLEISKNLREAGAKIWDDQLDLIPGQRWDDAITIALDQCQGMIIFLSPAATGSNNVLDEINFALEESKQIIPLIAVQCAIPHRLRRLQHTDFSNNESSAFKQLLNLIAGGKQEHHIQNTHLVEPEGIAESVEPKIYINLRNSEDLEDNVSPGLGLSEDKVGSDQNTESTMPIDTESALLKTLDTSIEDIETFGYQKPREANQFAASKTILVDNDSQANDSSIESDPEFHVSFSDSEYKVKLRPNRTGATMKQIINP